MTGHFYKIFAPSIGKGETITCAKGVMTPHEAMLHAITFFGCEGYEIEAGDEVEVTGPFLLGMPMLAFQVSQADLDRAGAL